MCVCAFCEMNVCVCVIVLAHECIYLCAFSENGCVPLAALARVCAHTCTVHAGEWGRKVWRLLQISCLKVLARATLLACRQLPAVSWQTILHGQR